MFHFCARTSLADLLKVHTSVPDALQTPDLPQIRLARWRTMLSLGFFGALRSSEYTDSALLSSCVTFDGISLASLSRLKSSIQSFSLSSLWEAVVSALHLEFSVL